MTHCSGARFRGVAWATLALSLALIGAAHAQTDAADGPAKTGPPPSAPLPTARRARTAGAGGARRAGEVCEFRRSVDATVAPSARIASIESQLPALDTRIAERRDRMPLAPSPQPRLPNPDPPPHAGA